MRITEAELLVRASRKSDFPRARLPEIAFVGRSNVGKSSLLNALVGQRRLARISSKPGCTRSIHFFRLNGRLLFADLPGYGYTRVSRSLQESWRPLVQSYLVGRQPLKLVWHLVDARHAPTQLDAQLAEWLAAEGIPFQVALTKVDKLSQAQRARCVARAVETLGLGEEDPPPVSTSSRKGTGLPVLWKIIDERIRDHAPGAQTPAGGTGRRDAAASGG